MTWFVGDNRTYLQKIMANILLNGPMPKHIGMIMDGNRRFANSKNIEKIEGHKLGFEKMTEALSWCLLMNVKEISVYAFSIENFKRTKQEVDGLFDLANKKLKDLLNEKSNLKQLGICVRFFGNLSYLPQNLQTVISEIVETTKHHRNFFFNFCFSYTSRDEMSTSIRDVNEGIMKKSLEITDINETIIEKSLFTNQSYKIDLMIRTSGEIRLSDFLLWQSNMSVLVFAKETWPEFSVWGFYAAILRFQLNYKNIQKMRISHIKQKEENLFNQKGKEIDKQKNDANRTNNLLNKNTHFFTNKKEIEGHNQRKELFYEELMIKRENIYKDILNKIESCNL